MKGMFIRTMVETALPKREAVLLCVVAFVHLVGIMLAFSHLVWMERSVLGENTLSIMLRSGQTSQDKQANQQVESILQEVKLAEAASSLKEENNPLKPADSSKRKAALGQNAEQNTNSLLAGALKKQAQPDPGILPNQAQQGPDVISSSQSPSPTPQMPPSSRLDYFTRTASAGKETTGRGHIIWEASKKNFSISGEFDSANILNFHSEGNVDAVNGLKPNIYIEKSQNGLPTNTIFNHEQKTILYAHLSVSQSWDGHVLDPSSVIWQLVNLGRLNGSQFPVGAVFNFQVAGANGSEEWKIEVVGPEEFDTAVGRLNTWHLARTSNPAADGKSVDMWLAPQKNWFPLKLRFSDADGSYSEMEIADILTLPRR